MIFIKALLKDTKFSTISKGTQGIHYISQARKQQAGNIKSMKDPSLCQQQIVIFTFYFSVMLTTSAIKLIQFRGKHKVNPIPWETK